MVMVGLAEGDGESPVYAIVVVQKLALRITYPIVQMAIVYVGRGCAMEVHEGAEQIAR